MIQIITRLFIVITIISITSFMTLSSFVFGTKEVHTEVDKTERKVEVYISHIVEGEDQTSTLEKTRITGNKVSLTSTDTLYVEFWRLASAMFISETKNLETNVLTLSGNTIIPLKEYPAIISLYDPFMLYNVSSVNKDYMIRQITNGSFYIGKESDGTVSVYSIDAVIRLDFLDNGDYMTDMVLFPGMYVRFDPRLNRTLAKADLFRIILSMVSNDEEAINRTWVEFVNPRITSSGDSDTFFMYRLSTFTRILFRSLHAEFSGRVKKLEDLEKYAFEYEYNIESTRSRFLSNPSKKNHFLLRELEGLLSQIVGSNQTKDDFLKQLQRIKDESKTLAIGNSVDVTLEEFLTDARFASFWTKNNNFQEIYNEIAQILNIAPIGAKAELLQKLSNIYSLNLSAQMKDKEFSRIDTYSPTAREIRETLWSTDIDTKDYFDIALYAFHVLKKAEDGGKYFDEAVTANATYDLLSTVFLATARSVSDPSEYKWLSIQFYDHILNTLVDSLYSLFTREDGERIFFKEKYLGTDGTIKLDDKQQFIKKLQDFDGTVEFVFQSIENAYENEEDLRTFLSIKKAKLRLHAFILLLEKWAYPEYVLSPYVSINTDGIALPKVSDDSETLVQAKIADKITDTGIEEDQWMVGIRNILWNIPSINIIKEESGYYVVRNADMEAVSPKDSTTLSYQLSATFSNDLKSITDISILYNERRINIITDIRDQSVITTLAQVLPNYLVAIDGIYEVNPNQTLTGEIRLFLDKSRVVIGNNIFPL